MYRAISIITCCSTLLAASAAAQSTPAEGRSGFHAAVGLGYGSVGVSCDGCGTTRENNPAIMLRFGGAIRPSIVLSGEVTGWTKDNSDGSTDQFSFVSFVTQWYPQPTNGFYVKGGIGGAALKSVGTDPTLGSVELSTTNLGLQGGVGYDLHLSPGFALTPYADFLYAVGADAKLNGGSTGLNVGANMIHVGLAASWGH
jgi:hypothetical protein